jgi:hypothetical protein
MTRISGSGRKSPRGMAYFIRRSEDGCAVIALHPGDREEVIASGLPIGEAEDLCMGKIEALRQAAPNSFIPPLIRRTGGGFLSQGEQANHTAVPPLI